MVDHSDKSRLPRVRECRRRRCTEAAFEGSTVAAWFVVGDEVEIERKGETGRRVEGQQKGGCGHHRRSHTGDGDEERGGGRRTWAVDLRDGRRNVVGLVGVAGMLGIGRC